MTRARGVGGPVRLESETTSWTLRAFLRAIRDASAVPAHIRLSCLIRCNPADPFIVNRSPEKGEKGARLVPRGGQIGSKQI